MMHLGHALFSTLKVPTVIIVIIITTIIVITVLELSFLFSTAKAEKF